MTRPTRPAGPAATRTPAQLFALVFGIIYLLVGILGFAWTGFDDWVAEKFNEEVIGIFAVNPLHNMVHILLGAVWIGAAQAHATAKSVNALLGVVLLAVGILGLAGVLKFLAIEDAASPDNYLHLATGVLALLFGTAAAEARRPAAV
jgi:hypothetical protein